MEAQIYVSRHAKKRLRQRVHKAVRRAAEAAFARGLEHGRLCGSLRRYVDHVALQSVLWHRSTISAFKIYFDNLYLFDGTRLVTVIPLPRRYVRLCVRLTRQHLTEERSSGMTIEKTYAIYNAQRGLYLGSLSERRTAAISEHAARQETTWSECRRRGDKLVQVAVRVIEEEA